MSQVNDDTRRQVRTISARSAPTGAHASLHAAALGYVAHSWGVVPVSACDGLTYYRGHTQQRVGTLAPALPTGRTLRDARVVWSRWHLAPYGIAARAGEDFDVLEAPTWLAVLAANRPMFRRRLCPVSIAPSGARLFVECGAVLRDELTGVRSVRMANPGSLVPLPPTRMLAGSVTWWITPEQVRWRLGDPVAIQNALCAVLAEASQIGGEARA